MIQLTPSGQLMEPNTRSELITEIHRLNIIIKNAIKAFNKYSTCEGDIIRIELNRKGEENENPSN